MGRTLAFVYGGPNGPMTEPALYLPKDRSVVLRVVRRPARRPNQPPTLPPRRRIPQTIRVDAVHLGDLSLPCRFGHSSLSADVLGPKAFREQLETPTR